MVLSCLPQMASAILSVTCVSAGKTGAGVTGADLGVVVPSPAACTSLTESTIDTTVTAQNRMTPLSDAVQNLTGAAHDMSSPAGRCGERGVCVPLQTPRITRRCPNINSLRFVRQNPAETGPRSTSISVY